MFFTILMVSLLLIGSSFAENEISQMTSIKALHLHMNAYIIELGQNYAVQTPLSQNSVYQKFEAQEETILSVHDQLVQNQQVPDEEKVELIKRPDEVITDWMNAAFNIIAECLGGIDPKKSPNPVQVCSNVMDATKKLIKNINDDSQIMEEFKKEECPLIARLSRIASNYETLKEQFENANST